MLVDISDYKFKGVFHIGAHHGGEVKGYFEDNEADRVVLFDPQRECYDKLIEQFGDDDRVVIEQLALGSSTESREMYVETANDGQSSSLLQPKFHLEMYPRIVFNEVIEVDVDTLDNYVQRKNIDLEDFDMINIDVQGFELEVFSGAIETLKSIDYILTEVNFVEMYHGCPPFDLLNEFLESQGFKVIDGYKVTHPVKGDPILNPSPEKIPVWGDVFYERVR